MELRIQETEDKKRSQNIGARKKKIENSKLRLKKRRQNSGDWSWKYNEIHRGNNKLKLIR